MTSISLPVRNRVSELEKSRVRSQNRIRIVKLNVKKPPKTVHRATTISISTEPPNITLELARYPPIDENSNLEALLTEISKEVALPLRSSSSSNLCQEVFRQRADTLLAHIQGVTWASYLPELEFRISKLVFFTQRARFIRNELIRRSRWRDVGTLIADAELLEANVNKLECLESEIRLLADIPGGIGDYTLAMEEGRCIWQ